MLKIPPHKVYRQIVQMHVKLGLSRAFFLKSERYNQLTVSLWVLTSFSLCERFAFAWFWLAFSFYCLVLFWPWSFFFILLLFIGNFANLVSWAFLANYSSKIDRIQIGGIIFTGFSMVSLTYLWHTYTRIENTGTHMSFNSTHLQ